MNKKELLATASFLVFYTGFIFTGFNWMLSARIKAEVAPVKAEITLVKENQARMEKRIDRMATRMDRMETEQKDIKERIIRIESMLGQILIAQNLHHKGKTKPVGKFKKPSTAKPVQRKTASH